MGIYLQSARPTNTCARHFRVLLPFILMLFLSLAVPHTGFAQGLVGAPQDFPSRGSYSNFVPRSGITLTDIQPLFAYFWMLLESAILFRPRRSLLNASHCCIAASSILTFSVGIAVIFLSYLFQPCSPGLSPSYPELPLCSIIVAAFFIALPAIQTIFIRIIFHKNSPLLLLDPPRSSVYTTWCIILQATALNVLAFWWLAEFGDLMDSGTRGWTVITQCVFSFDITLIVVSRAAFHGTGLKLLFLSILSPFAVTAFIYLAGLSIIGQY